MFIKTAFKRMPIKQKTILLMMVIAVVSVVLTTVSSIISGVIYLTNNEKTELTILAEIVGDKNAAALAFQDSDLVKANLNILSSKLSVRKACIYTTDNRLFAEYTPKTKSAIPCHLTTSDSVVSARGMAEISYTIHKKGNVLGRVYIQSDLRAVNNYIKKQITASAGIIAIICLVAYLLILQLQRVISNPIKSLADEIKAISEDNYSVRTQRIYDNELGTIAECFNKILEEREHRHKAFFEKAETMDHMIKSSAKTLSTLDDEALFTFKAASTFKMLLEKEVFGPVNAMYNHYFNDVYTAEMQLYYVLVKAVHSLKLQSEVFSSNQEAVELVALVHEIVKTSHETAGEDPRFTYHITASAKVPFLCYRKPLQRMLENIAALFMESKKLGQLYHSTFSIQKAENNVTILATLAVQNPSKPSSNDNYLTLPLSDLISRLKNNEAIGELKGDYFIDLSDVIIRSRLYFIYFLSSINHAEVEAHISAQHITLAFKAQEQELTEQKAEAKELTSA